MKQHKGDELPHNGLGCLREVFSFNVMVCCCVVAAVHFKSLDAGEKKKELDSEFEQQRKAVIEAAVQQQSNQSATRTNANSPAVRQVGQHLSLPNARSKKLKKNK